MYRLIRHEDATVEVGSNGPRVRIFASIAGPRRPGAAGGRGQGGGGGRTGGRIGTLACVSQPAAESRRITLSTPPSPAHGCTIEVSPGLLSEVGDRVRSRFHSTKAIVITDSTVGPLHLPRLERSLRDAGISPVVHTLPAGEAHKHLVTLLPAYETCLAATIDRQTPLLALGGGVVGDMAGFLAATLLRGLPFVQVPTTLMAMVDSSIGGKTGVNQPGSGGGKNLIGAFHQPTLVLSDPALLSTLPEAELSNGLAECIKHDALADPAHLARLTSTLPGVFARRVNALADLVRHNVAIKARIVEQDPTERGIRAHLNLGHTFAHAFEAVTRHALPHGQAVALGLAAAAHLSVDLGLLSPAEREVLLAAVTAAGLPTTYPPPLAPLLTDPAPLLSAMAKDKKVESGRLRFVLLAPLGTPVIRSDVSPDSVRSALLRLHP